MTALTLVISVSGWLTVLALLAAPVLNSTSVPATRTRLPTAGANEVLKTNRPSDVAGLPSPVRSWMKKPLLLSFVTTPTVVTAWLTKLLAVPLPCSV